MVEAVVTTGGINTTNNHAKAVVTTASSLTHRSHQLRPSHTLLLHVLYANWEALPIRFPVKSMQFSVVGGHEPVTHVDILVNHNRLSLTVAGWVVYVCTVM